MASTTVGGRHTEPLLDRVERRTEFGEQLAALGSEVRERRLSQIVGRTQHELRLRRLRPLRLAGQNQIRKRQIGLKAARRRVEGLAGDAELLRLGPERLHEALERGVGGLRGA